MKHYYYAENDKQFGPFTLDELKTRRIKKSTLVWAEGMEEWSTADQVHELKEHIIAEPPPLPNKKPDNAQPLNTTTYILDRDSNNNIYDLSYKKEKEATEAGIFLIVLNIIFILFYKYVKLENTIGNNHQDMYPVFSLIFITVRIGITAYVVKIAHRLNRDQFQWGIFGFFLPSISLIVIGMKHKLKFQIKIDQSLSKTEQYNILQQQAGFFAKNKRNSEAIDIYKLILKNYEASNSDIFKLAELLYLNKQYAEAELLFLKIKGQNEFSNISNYYLGFISVKKKDLIGAQEYLKLDRKTENSLFLLNTLLQTSMDSLPTEELKNKYGLIHLIYYIGNLEITAGLENFDLGIWQNIKCSIDLYWNGTMLIFSENIRKGKVQSFFFNFYLLKSIERIEENSLKLELENKQQIIFSSKDLNHDSLELIEKEYKIAKDNFLN